MFHLLVKQQAGKKFPASSVFKRRTYAEFRQVNLTAGLFYIHLFTAILISQRCELVYRARFKAQVGKRR